MPFQLVSSYQPAGDQPSAIEQLTNGILQGERYQTLLGVTGSGKTFTMANVIQNVQRPTLVLTHNKTLVAQLYGEFKQFFPDNAVGYFVSYYDYYQPEAYMPVSDTYIEKDLSINEELDKLRLQATSQLLTGRRDIIVVASVSCIYGMGNPTEFENGIVRIKEGQIISRQGFLHGLVNGLYSRTQGDFARGTFRVKGDTVDINLPYLDHGYRITFFGDEIESIETLELSTGKRISRLPDAAGGLEIAVGVVRIVVVVGVGVAVVEEILDRVDGNGEPDALTEGQFHVGDADDFAAQVKERAAAVAGMHFHSSYTIDDNEHRISRG